MPYSVIHSLRNGHTKGDDRYHMHTNIMLNTNSMMSPNIDTLGNIWQL